ncbi:MAG: protein kinase [Elusimicrobia bacterium]|nr:protein kinase [Elusimicrobiota bacterium]
MRENPTGGWENQAAAISRAAEGEHEDALPYFRAAIENGREEPRILTWAALSAYNTGDMAQASEWAHRARMLDPKGPLSGQAGAIEKMALNRLSDAKPGKEQTPGEAMTAEAGGKPAAFPDPASTPDPPRPKSGAAVDPSALELANRYAAEARAAVKVGDNARAVERATKALEQDPDDARALNLRAAAFARMGRYSEAKADAERGLDLAAGYIPLLLTRSIAAARTGKPAEAKQSALEVLRKDARNPAALRLLAFAQAADRDREGMLATLRKADPADPAAAQALSRALTLPPEADATVLFSDAVLFGEAAAPLAAAPAPKRGLPKLLLVVGASLLAGLIAGGVILLAGRDRDGAASWTPRPAAAPAEESIGPYRILGTLGAGGMGVVYKAEDPALERTLALKRMRDEIAEDPRERERFLQEARTVSKLDHPGIVRIFSVYEGGEGTFLVFELVDGRTLSEILGERGVLPFAEARGILAQACEAVAYAHSKHVVHRDLKPSNIMQDLTGRVRVMDFGIARAAKDALTRLTAQGTIAGTPGYMAPEQEEGRSSPASDVYALGVCFYEMLTGRTPFAGSGIALYQAKRAGKFPPLQLPGHPEADAVLAKALHPDPAQRYASPKDLAAALNAVPA